LYALHQAIELHKHQMKSSDFKNRSSSIIVSPALQKFLAKFELIKLANKMKKLRAHLDLILK